MPAANQSFMNKILFLLSIIIVSTIWPHQEGDNWIKMLGNVIVISSCYIVIYFFLLNFYSEVLRVTTKVFFIVLFILSFIIITKIVLSYTARDLLPLVPFVIIPVIIRTFYDSRLALFIYLVTILMSAFFVPDPFEFVFINTLSGVIALLTLTNTFRKARIFLTAMIVVLNYSVI